MLEKIQAFKLALQNALESDKVFNLGQIFDDVKTMKQLHHALDFAIESGVFSFNALENFVLNCGFEFANQLSIHSALKTKYDQKCCEVLNELSKILPDPIKTEILLRHDNSSLEVLKSTLELSKNNVKTQGEIAKIIQETSLKNEDTKDRKELVIKEILSFCKIYKKSWLQTQDLRFLEFVLKQIVSNRNMSLDLENKFKKELSNLEKIDDDVVFIHEVKLLKSRLKPREVKLFLSFLIDLDNLLLRDKILKIIKGN